MFLGGPPLVYVVLEDTGDRAAVELDSHHRARLSRAPSRQYAVQRARGRGTAL